MFDERGNLLKSNKVKREGCIIGILDDKLDDNNYVKEQYEIRNWSNYIFYYISLIDYLGSSIPLKRNLDIQIDDRPSLKRKDFKLAFEDWNVKSIDDSYPLYEVFGSLYLNMPNTDVKNFEVKLVKLDKGTQIIENGHFEKLNTNNVEFLLQEDLLQDGFYNLLIRYKNKLIFREEFALVHHNYISNEFNMEYSNENNNYRRIVVSKANPYYVIPAHINTLVSSDDKSYSIEPLNVPIAKFGIKLYGKEILVKKVVNPIQVQIIGIDNLIMSKASNRVNEITKTAFNDTDTDIRINIGNYDYRHSLLIYQLIISDSNTGDSICETRKLLYNDQFTLSLSSMKDRVTQFANMSVHINVRTHDNEVLYNREILGITQEIEMVDCKKTIKDKRLTLTWNERHDNKGRILRLYNFTMPWTEPIEIKLQDGINTIEIELPKYNFGVYIPSLDYEKKSSLFENNIANQKFYRKENLDNLIVNKYGIKKSKHDLNLCKLLLAYANRRADFTKVDTLLEGMVLDGIKLDNIYFALLQMKYFTDLDNHKELERLLNHSYIIMKNLLDNYDKDELVAGLLKNKDNLEEDDIIYILNLILSLKRDIIPASRTIDLITDIDIVNALCCVENGSGNLTQNLIAGCRDSFDDEVLRLVRDHKGILDVISYEAQLVNEFWNWIVSFENQYILKHEYSKAEIFRIYAFENDIYTNRVAGKTVDDIVDSIQNETLHIPFRYRSTEVEDPSNDLDIFNDFAKLLQLEMDKSYKEVITVAFLLESGLHTYNDKQCFDLIMQFYFGGRKDLFERYRAYFKLIFI